jgi:hypothetical protein
LIRGFLFIDSSSKPRRDSFAVQVRHDQRLWHNGRDGFVPSGLRIESVVSHRHIDTEPCAFEPADRAMYDECEIAGNTENLDEERFCCEALSWRHTTVSIPESTSGP